MYNSFLVKLGSTNLYQTFINNGFYQLSISSIFTFPNRYVSMYNRNTWSSSTYNLAAIFIQKLKTDKLDSGALQNTRGINVRSISSNMDEVPKNIKNVKKTTKLESVESCDNMPSLSIHNPHWIDLGMKPQVIDLLSKKGFTKFTPVQADTYEPIVSGRDVIARSRTGTGKTLAYGNPSLHRVLDTIQKKCTDGNNINARGVSMLVLCPTRELSRQVSFELSEISKPLGLVISTFHGGVSYDPQIRAIRQGIDVLVGTPGRIIDHISRQSLSLKHCQIVILDEADEMLNMGFAQDVDTILEDLGVANDTKPQFLLFSATTPKWVYDIACKYQDKNSLSIDASNNNEARTATTIRHIAIQVPINFESKKEILEDIISVEISKYVSNLCTFESSKKNKISPIGSCANTKVVLENNCLNSLQRKIFGKTIVFTDTKRDADELVSGNVFKSLTAQSIHGDVSQLQRDKTLSLFRSGAFDVLVATDVAARGIDIKNVDLVVQLAPPRDNDTYVHRSGRTGRAGEKGTSVIMFDIRQKKDIIRIEQGLGHGFKFEIMGPPSSGATFNAIAKTASLVCRSVSDDVANCFLDSALSLLKDSDETPEMIIAKCLASMSRRSSASLVYRSLLTGETGMITLEMSRIDGKPVSPGDVVFTVSKLSKKSSEDETITFGNSIGKIQRNNKKTTTLFDMNVIDAKKLINFCHDQDFEDIVIKIVDELELDREKVFGSIRNISETKGYKARDARRIYRNDRFNGWKYNLGIGNNDSHGRKYKRKDYIKQPSELNYRKRLVIRHNNTRNVDRYPAI